MEELVDQLLTGDVVKELVKLLPSILWFLLVAIFLILFYRPIRYELLPRLSGVNVMGVEFSFIEKSIDDAIELARKSPQWNIEVPRQDKEHALNRAKEHLEVFRKAQILWVDDYPENNRNELRMFHQLKAEIDTAKSTNEALRILRNHNYDLVISDMARGKKAAEGLEFLRKLRRDDKNTPVIFYIGVIDPKKGVPPQAFGITNRPDELLHLILDALERKKY